MLTLPIFLSAILEMIFQININIKNTWCILSNSLPVKYYNQFAVKVHISVYVKFSFKAFCFDMVYYLFYFFSDAQAPLSGSDVA